ncbi:Ribosomal RNA-processing protein 7-like A [Cricetulus griseus]|uniref:Ribosomal RNA-processing protein 7-like A n=1 Tax=Cricetulus griseus TaxID=10029 RepID=G3I6C7_CRIGR|nr:Ribosomal RNA-processing protein 7-like A [Cricetulus griseus]
MVALKRKAGACGHEGSTPSPLSYSAIHVKFTKQQQASHYLYVRQHRVRGDTQSTWPPIFVLNVTPYCTEECLSRLLSSCGTIKTVDLKEKPDHAESTKDLEGDWVNIAIAADNVEKIENQGTMRLYAHQITCHEECDKLEITFYVK